MADNRDSAFSSILITKFQAPVPGFDLITRPHLIAQLDVALALPLTLLSAPAGYGKSTIIGQWLSDRSVASAWLSLDADDDDPITFLTYLTHAVNNSVPELCATTLTALEANTTTSPHVLIKLFINDLNKRSDPLVMVLDDYHYIRDERIHDLMMRLLKYLPHALHIVVASRFDPPWSLSEMRLKHRIAELRVHDLAFSDTETRQFLTGAVGSRFQPEQTAHLAANLEGWPGGLRLLALMLRTENNVNQPAQVRTIIHGPGDAFGLMREFLDHLPWALHQRLLALSILNRFCAPLIDAVLTPEQSETNGIGQHTIDWLQQSELFLIPLDNQGFWFRFHHLFQLRLRGLLADQSSPVRITALHERAASWFAANGLIDEAISHALEADNEPMAVGLIAAHRHEALNSENWHLLGRWLARFPSARIQTDAELLLTQAVLEDSTFWFTGVDLDRVETLIENQVTDPNKATLLRAELAGVQAGHLNQKGEYEQARALAQRALDTLPPEYFHSRQKARLRLGAAQIAVGDLEATRITAQSAALEPMGDNPRHRIRAAYIMCQYYWSTSDHVKLEHEARHILKQYEPAPQRDVLETWASAHIYLGYLSYLQNHLEQAREHFTTVNERRYQISVHSYTESLRGLIMVSQAQNLVDEVLTLLEDLTHYQLENGINGNHQDVATFRADILLRNNRHHEALLAMASVSLLPVRILEHVRYPLPQLAAARVYAAQPDAASRAMARDMLEAVLNFEQRIQNWRLLSEALAVLASLEATEGNADSALNTLAQAIELAAPRQLIRCLLDAGPGIYPLLLRYCQEYGRSDFLDAVLAACTTSTPQITTVSATPPMHLLTERETEILILVQQRLSNKEIADRLVVSVATVKRHIMNIFDKLGVNRRRDAVAYAQELGLLDGDKG